jgi:hypothetical protein
MGKSLIDYLIKIIEQNYENNRQSIINDKLIVVLINFLITALKNFTLKIKENNYKTCFSKTQLNNLFNLSVQIIHKHKEVNVKDNATNLLCSI